MKKKTSSYVHRGLTELGYIVDVATNGIDGLHYALEWDYDVVILDVMLPGKDGYDVLQGLRLQKKTPVIMLSARGRWMTAFEGCARGR